MVGPGWWIMIAPGLEVCSGRVWTEGAGLIGGRAADPAAGSSSFQHRMRADDEGSATVALAGTTAAVLALSLVLITASVLFANKSQLQGVADMAALAGADATPVSTVLVGQTSNAGCEPASAVVELNNSSLMLCEVDGSGDVRVVVTRRVSLLGLSVLVSAKARAGPHFPIEKLGGR